MIMRERGGGEKVVTLADVMMRVRVELCDGGRGCVSLSIRSGSLTI